MLLKLMSGAYEYQVCTYVLICNLSMVLDHKDILRRPANTVYRNLKTILAIPRQIQHVALSVEFCLLVRQIH